MSRHKCEVHYWLMGDGKCTCPRVRKAQGSFAAPTGLAAVKREARFYREQLELICKDSRKTRARRLAESALTFWDSLKAEAAKRKKAKAAND
jgi:hypothetical protein